MLGLHRATILFCVLLQQSEFLISRMPWFQLQRVQLPRNTVVDLMGGWAWETPICGCQTFQFIHFVCYVSSSGQTFLFCLAFCDSKMVVDDGDLLDNGTQKENLFFKHSCNEILFGRNLGNRRLLKHLRIFQRPGCTYCTVY